MSRSIVAEIAASVVSEVRSAVQTKKHMAALEAVRIPVRSERVFNFSSHAPDFSYALPHGFGGSMPAIGMDRSIPAGAGKDFDFSGHVSNPRNALPWEPAGKTKAASSGPGLRALDACQRKAVESISKILCELGYSAQIKVLPAQTEDIIQVDFASLKTHKDRVGAFVKREGKRYE